MTAPLLTTSTLAAHSACQVVGRATPNMLVNPGVSREADDQQIDGIFPDKIANHPNDMSGRDHGLESTECIVARVWQCSASCPK